MAHPALTSAHAKLAWADQHLDVFYEEFMVFAKRQAHRAKLDIRSEEVREFIVSIEPFPEPPPQRLSMLVGDVLQNARSALDHAVCGIIYELTGEPPTNRNAFPVYLSPDDFRKDVVEPKRPERGQLFNLPREHDAWAVIEWAQPYKTAERAGQPDPTFTFLHLLHRLNNREKHRSLTIATQFPDRDSILGLYEVRRGKLLEQEAMVTPISVEHRTDILRMRFDRTGPKPEVRVKNPIALQPMVGDQTGLMQIAGLHRMTDAVAEVLRALGTTMREPPPGGRRDHPFPFSD